MQCETSQSRQEHCNVDKLSKVAPSHDHTLGKRSSSICSNLNNLFVTLNLSTAADTTSIDDENDTLSMTSSDRSCEMEEEKTVRFGPVEIREYSVIQGDHPTCKGGLALSLGWKYQTMGNFEIEDLEDRGSFDDDEEDNDDDCSCGDTVDISKKRPRRLNYFERRMILERTGFIVGDGHGRSKCSVWIGFDDHYMPDI
mmetsp:Transcript_1555/g.2130  ORF Transcript_1555/g.2130 Transcript_1555/m.2130 type:complete len:198 (-) Transcript_1555:68-661(-)